MKTFNYEDVNPDNFARYESLTNKDFEEVVCQLQDLVGEDGSYRTIFSAESVKFKTFNTREAKQINKILSRTQHRRKMRGYRIFYKLALVLQHMIISVGENVFFDGNGNEVMPENERLNVLKNMYYADVMAMYIMLAHYSLEPLDNILKMEIEEDGVKLPIQFDLNECNIIGFEDIQSAIWSYELKVPFKIRGELVDKIICGPGPFRCYINTPIRPEDNDTHDFTEAVVGCIYGIPALGDSRPALSPKEIEDMHIEDLKAISELISERCCGIDQKVMVSDSDDLESKRETFLQWWDPDFLI